MLTQYDQGDSVTLTCTFTNSAGTNTDPTEVILRVKDASGNVDVYTYTLAEITQSATGIYTKAITLDESGDWFYRWEATGDVIAAVEGAIYVKTSNVV
jgi:hypothetical protein